jgi:Xaa-Pro aminopeptidase
MVSYYLPKKKLNSEGQLLPTKEEGKQHRQYEIGMVTTVEPGIYIRKSDKIDPEYWDIGIRIEDDEKIKYTKYCYLYRTW